MKSTSFAPSMYCAVLSALETLLRRRQGTALGTRSWAREITGRPERRSIATTYGILTLYDVLFRGTGTAAPSANYNSDFEPSSPPVRWPAESATQACLFRIDTAFATSLYSGHSNSRALPAL